MSYLDTGMMENSAVSSVAGVVDWNKFPMPMFFVQCFWTETSALTGLFSGMTYPFCFRPSFAHRALARLEAAARIAGDQTRPRFLTPTGFWTFIPLETRPPDNAAIA